MVEVERLLHEHVELVEVPVVVELRPLNHHEEAFLVLVEQAEAFERGFSEQVATFVGQRGVDIVGHAEHLSFLPTHHIVNASGDVVAFGFELFEDVAAILAVKEILCTAAKGEVAVGIHVVGRQFLLLVTVDDVAAEIAGCGIPEAACHGYSCVASILLGQRYERFERLSLWVYSHSVVESLVACSQ